MGHILLLREDLVVASLNEVLLQSNWDSDEYIIVLLRDWDKLDLCVVLSNLVVSQEIHQVEAHNCVHFLRVRDEGTELLIVVGLEDAHMLLILSNIMLFNTQEGSILVNFSGKDAFLGLSIEARGDIFEEGQVRLQLLHQLVSLAKSGRGLW